MLEKVRDICHTYFIDKERQMPGLLDKHSIKVNVRVRRNRFSCCCLSTATVYFTVYSALYSVHIQR